MKIIEVIYKKEHTKWTINNSPYDDVYTLIKGDLVDISGISVGKLYTLQEILEMSFEEFEEK